MDEMKLYRTTIVQEHPDGPHISDPTKNGRVVLSRSAADAFIEAVRHIDATADQEVNYVCVQFLSKLDTVESSEGNLVLREYGTL